MRGMTKAWYQHIVVQVRSAVHVAIEFCLDRGPLFSVNRVNGSA